jgi:hypothetical protein
MKDKGEIGRRGREVKNCLYENTKMRLNLMNIGNNKIETSGESVQVVIVIVMGAGASR